MNWKVLAITGVILSILGSVSTIQAKPNDSGEMARIPAGNFWMGSPDGVGDPDEHPRHQVYLDAFASTSI